MQKIFFKLAKKEISYVEELGKSLQHRVLLLHQEEQEMQNHYQILQKSHIQEKLN